MQSANVYSHSVYLCILLGETLSSAVILHICGHGILDLRTCGIAESRKGHWENVNEVNESADPNAGCALIYIKAVFHQKRLRHSAHHSSLESLLRFARGKQDGQ